MDNTGRLKIHRKITERERYSDVNVRLVFLHLLFSVNHKEKKRQGQTIWPWEIITSYGSLAASVWLSVQQTRTALKKLQSTGEINQQSTNKWQRVILINWGKYQAKENDSNKQTTNEEQTNNNQTTNNQQQLKNIRIKEDIEDIYSHRQSKEIKVHARLTSSMRSSIKTLLDELSAEEIKKAIDNYAEILFSEKTYFTHKWTIAEFCKRKLWARVFVDKEVGDYLVTWSKPSSTALTGSEIYSPDNRS